MQTPLRILFDGLPADEQLRAACAREMARLERSGARLTDCQVTIQQPHQHAQSGKHYEIHVLLNVPGAALATRRSAAQDAQREHADRAIRLAFDGLRRQLHKRVGRQRDVRAGRAD